MLLNQLKKDLKIFQLTNQLENRLKLDLEKRSENNALRELKRKSDLSDFSSNDYLGFAKLNLNSNQNIGSGGSRLLSGNSIKHEELEAEIAKFHGHEAALIFNSGYSANVGLLSTIPQRGDVVIYDELIHASIRDGLKMSNARSFSFKHNDIRDLQEKLKRTEGNVFVVVETVYSMDGDVAPLKSLVEVCRGNEANLIVDEAHSVGLYGKEGRGLVNQLDLENELFARIITYGKAFGFHGAAILGSDTLRTYLINYCRSFIYTTAISKHDIDVLSGIYSMMKKADSKRLDLSKKVDLFNSQLNRHPNYWSPIQTFQVRGNAKVKSLSLELEKQGFDVRPIMSPTVPKGEERLRICIHVYNTDEDIKKLCQFLLNYK